VTSWTLQRLNAVPDDERLRSALRDCCAADAWVAAIVASRPYADEQVLAAASDVATAALNAAGFAQALAGHPRIGERVNGHTGRLSLGEQAGVDGADASLRAELAEANAAYERRFGHVYLVYATGRSAKELLAVCRGRLANDPVTERRVALAELAAINRLRLDKLLREEGS
jgi:2-oxo-4-hydroxy-4-carboxy-5-ureidoimidazoline decarboxylase